MWDGAIHKDKQAQEKEGSIWERAQREADGKDTDRLTRSLCPPKRQIPTGRGTLTPEVVLRIKIQG